MVSERGSYYISLILLSVTLVCVVYDGMRPQYVVADTHFDEIPMQVESLVATNMFFQNSVYAVLNADANLLRLYRPLHQTDDITLYLGYYGTAKGGRPSHFPQSCYTGQGWSIEQWDLLRIDSPFGGRTRVNKMVVKKGSQRQLVYFWFQTKTTILASGWEQNWHKFYHRLVDGKNDGAFVRVSMAMPYGQEEAAEEQIKSFAIAIMPEIAEVWPVETVL